MRWPRCRATLPLIDPEWHAYAGFRRAPLGLTWTRCTRHRWYWGGHSG